jgi:hypothetical protein
MPRGGPDRLGRPVPDLMSLVEDDPLPNRIRTGCWLCNPTPKHAGACTQPARYTDWPSPGQSVVLHIGTVDSGTV